MRRFKERMLSFVLTFVMVLSIAVGMAPAEVKADETSGDKVRSLESWVKIIGNQLIINPDDDTVDYVILDVPEYRTVDFYNTIVVGSYVGDTESEIYSGNVHEYTKKRGDSSTTINDGRKLYVATFRETDGYYYPITGVWAFACQTETPAINSQPTSNTPTFDVQYGNIANYQWYEADMPVFTVANEDSSNTIKVESDMEYAEGVWNSNGGGYFKINLQKNDVWEVQIKDGIGSFAELYDGPDVPPKEIIEMFDSIKFIAPETGVYTLWLYGTEGEITSTVTHRTPIAEQNTNTFTGEPGTYVCEARWGNYILMSDPVEISEVTNALFIDKVDVQVDWSKIPELESGSREIPEFDGVSATITGEGTSGLDFMWGVKVDDSFKITPDDEYYEEFLEEMGDAEVESYNEMINSFKINYGWAPLVAVLQNPYYKINENDVYSMVVGLLANDGYTFGGVQGDDYTGTVTSNVAIGCKKIDDDAGRYLVLFFQLGTLSEMEEVKNPHVHTYVEVAAKAPTCTEAGCKAYYTCSGCEDIFTDKNGTTTTLSALEVKALGHDWSGEWTTIKEATATEEGKKETFCANDCGQKKVAIIAKVGEIDKQGNLEKDAEVTPEAAIEEVTLDNTKEELMKSDIFTDTEKQAIEDGAEARVWLEIGNVDVSQIAAKDKAAVENEAKKFAGENVKLTYFDASLFKQVGNGQKIGVEKPGTAMKITIVIPEELINKDKTIEREYQIIRLHKGEVDLLAGEFNAETGEFTFTTDRFSTYAVIYEDTAVVPEVPKTGDATNFMPILALLFAGLGMVVVGKKKRA